MRVVCLLFALKGYPIQIITTVQAHCLHFQMTLCTAGASYGGYPSLWGLIKEPDLYQCAISWVGVSDLSYLYSIAWSDSTEEVDKYFLPKTVGDKNAGAAPFKATSVMENAGKLKKPLLLAYAGEDQRVPLNMANV